MTPIKRPIAAAGAAVLLAFSLSACGGPPTDASVEDYCDAVQDDSAFEGFDENSDEEDFVDALKEQAEKIEEVGTPEDIPDDARKGFEISLDAVDDLEADDIDLENLEDFDFEENLSNEEKDQVGAYDKYESETCSEEGTDPGVTE